MQKTKSTSKKALIFIEQSDPEIASPEEVLERLIAILERHRATITRRCQLDEKEDPDYEKRG